MIHQRSKKEQIGDFLYGHGVAEAVLNALCYRLSYGVMPIGIEHSYGAINKQLRAKFYSTSNLETKKNIAIMRMEPDAQIISPSGYVMKLEIKADDHDSIESFFRSSYWGLKNVEEVLKFYPTTRFVFVNIRLRKISTISGMNLLDEESQRQNWDQPWHWIEGLNSETQFNNWADEYIFDPLSLSAEKIVSKFSNNENKLLASEKLI